MSFQPIQREVDEWISQFEEGYFPPLAMLARLAEEVGELARALAHEYAGKTPKLHESKGDVAEELADALFVMVCMANSLNIDLDEAFAGVMGKYRARDSDRWTRKSGD